MSTATVHFNPNGGHIVLSVKSGPPCIGGFRLFSRDNRVGDVVQLFPTEPNLIHDQLPDNLPLPFTLSIIQHITLRIIGRYGPLPNHTQIGVRYLFTQDGQVLNVTPNNGNVIQENHTPPPPFKQYNHDFNFQPIN